MKLHKLIVFIRRSLHAPTTSKMTSLVVLQRAALRSSPQRLLTPLLMETRQFSMQTRRRPQESSSRSGNETPNRRQLPKYRTHAVNLFDGDYSDDPKAGFDRDSRKKEEGNATGDQFEKEMADLVSWAKTSQAEYEERRQRWVELSKPPIRHSQIDVRGRAYGRGGRKKASARVWIQPGMGEVVVNRKELLEYFPREAHREDILAPFVATETCGKFDVQCHVQGGGLSGQAGAVRHGLARALNHYNPDLYRPPLKRLGYLTRDPRKVERKKVGKVKARKSPQWVRR